MHATFLCIYIKQKSHQLDMKRRRRRKKSAMNHATPSCIVVILNRGVIEVNNSCRKTYFLVRLRCLSNKFENLFFTSLSNMLLRRRLRRNKHLIIYFVT